MSKALADKGNYKQKGVIRKVIDKYVGKIEMLESKHVLCVDQKELKTVIPKIDSLVRIVNGTYRGLNARLLAVDTDKFCAEVRIEKGVYDGRVLKAVEFKDICEIAHCHSSRPVHPLELKTSQKPYYCNGCKEPGFGKRYRCDVCDFDLHEDCMFFTHETSHNFFHNSAFKFFDQPLSPRKCCKCNKCNKCDERKRYCDACGKPVTGFGYHCQEDDLDLHPCCLKLQHTIYGDGGIKLKLSDKVSSKCVKCKSKEISEGIKGWSYVSSCGEFCYHVACVKDLFMENWKNGYFDGDVDQKNNLALMQINTSTCNEVVQSGGGWFGSKDFWKIARMVLKLVISAIFGDPITGIATVVEALIS